MSRRTEASLARCKSLAACAFGLALAGSAAAAPPAIPRLPLAAPEALAATVRAEIGATAEVLELRYDEHFVRLVVERNGDFDEFEARGGKAFAPGRPLKVRDVECRRKIPLARVDFALGAELRRQASAIAAAQGLDRPILLSLGADMQCKRFGWTAQAFSADNERWLRLTWAPDGSKPQAEEYRDGRSTKRDFARLAAAVEARAKAAPPTPGGERAGVTKDNAAHDFIGGLAAELERLAHAAPAPLALLAIRVDPRNASVDLQPAGDTRRIATWSLWADGRIEPFHERQSFPGECRKPFAPGDFPLASLPVLLGDALTRLPAMPNARLKDLAIRRGGICGGLQLQIEVEDERGYGLVEYDARGRFVTARIL